MTNRRLYRSRRECMVAGVCGGLAEYFDIDPTIVRVVYVLLTLFNGTGVALYILMWIIVPEEPAKAGGDKSPKEEPEVKSVSKEVTAKNEQASRSFWGVILVLIGGVMLLQRLVPWNFDGALLVPTVLIAIGLVIVARSFDS